MTGKRWLTAILTALLLVLLSRPVGAQEAATAYGLFFYSPTCPHCHEVIENHWPAIQSEFGDQLKVLFVDASTPQGGAIMDQTRAAMQIESQGVPMLILGPDVLIGSVDIPQRAPEIVRTGLAQGGIPIPSVPGLDEIFAAALAQADATASGEIAAGASEPSEATAAAPVEQAQPDIATDASALTRATLPDRFAADPVANSLALLVLALLVGSVVAAPASFQARFASPVLAETIPRVLALLGTAIGLALLVGSRQEPAVMLLAAALLLAFGALLLQSLRRAAVPVGHDWRIPLIMVAGLGVSAYLAWVELNQSEAVCGAVGNCNAVQQSAYAQIGGVPIGMLGIVGYLILLLLWLVARGAPPGAMARKALLALTFAGVLFSTYLTFLEPFVIGATCLWCLTSALLMLMLLWLLLPREGVKG